MDDIIIKRKEDLKEFRKVEHGNFEYIRRDFVPVRKDGQCKMAVYEIPPKKSAYPYHYHLKNEEIFYILKGQGILKMPSGERIVTVGDMIFFPANENGAHKLTNISDSENLVYLDFDTHNDIDVAFYPDSGKIGIWGKSINQLYKTDAKVNYYEGE